MTKHAILKKLEQLSDDEFELVAPYLEADLESMSALADFHREVAAGRQSAGRDPILDAKTVYARVRDALRK